MSAWSPTTLELIANGLAGLHSVLILYFLVGWLIPFASFRIRALSNLILGGIFLFYRFNGGCPLTTWEMGIRSLYEPQAEYGASFLARSAAQWGIPLGVGTIDMASLILTLIILAFCLGIIFYHQKPHRSIMKIFKKA